MLRVSGLPVDITKSELDKLFSPYGTITLLGPIRTEKSAAIAEVKLHGNVSAAAKELDGKPFRGQCHLTIEAHPEVDGLTSYEDKTISQAGASKNKKQGGRGI